MTIPSRPLFRPPSTSPLAWTIIIGAIIATMIGTIWWSFNEGYERGVWRANTVAMERGR